MSTKTKFKVGSIAIAAIIVTLLIVICVKTVMAATLIVKIGGVVLAIGTGIYFFIRWRK